MKCASRLASLCCVALALAWSACSPANAAPIGSSSPNILFVLTDDQGPWTPGFAGNPQSHTPHLDRLAATGVHFVNAFVTTPVCSPSRTTLITGRYASELGISDWLLPDSEHGLDRSVATWPALLRDAGYRTGLVGKWHLGQRPEFHPRHYGYDHFMGFLTGGTKTANPTLEKDGEALQFEGLTEDILTDEAIAFIARDDGRPFLLSLHYRAPHAAYLPVSDADWAHFAERPISIPEHPGLDQAETRKRMREYLASVAAVDRNLGRLLAALDAEGLSERTIVVFTSDHGYNMGHHGIWAKGNGVYLLEEEPPQRWPAIPPGRRPNLWDTSLKTPVVVRWPGVAAPGRRIEECVTNLDWFPTLCAMAGVAIPEGTLLRGKNLVPLIEGNVSQWDNMVYAEYDMIHGAETHMRAWRTPEWKLMRDFKSPGRAELYHLTQDPDELVNLIESTDAEVVRVIRDFDKRIRAQMERIGDPVLAHVPEQSP